MRETAGNTPSQQARRGRSVLLIGAVVVAALDLTAKAFAETRLTNTSVDLGPLQLRLAHNSGVAFSLGDAFAPWVVLTVTAAITAVLALYGWRHVPGVGRVQQLAGGAILGGAVANVVDRARDGVVTDYLHTGWWPTFNLADTFLVLGGIVLVLGQLHAERRGARPTDDDSSAAVAPPDEGAH